MFLSIKRLFNRNSLNRKDGLNFRRRRRKLDFDKVKYVGVLLLELAIVIGLSYGVVISFGNQVECSNSSMEPT